MIILNLDIQKHRILYLAKVHCTLILTISILRVLMMDQIPKWMNG